MKAFQLLLDRHAEDLRIKELFETVEVWKKVVAHLQRCNEVRRALGSALISHIYDIASGHGLLSVLLAYRFPHVTVVAVDREQRPGFARYVAAVDAFGEALPGAPRCLSNLSFEVSAFHEVHTEASSALVCVHGCNELNLEVLRRARHVGAVWLVLPCCVREGLASVALRCRDEQGDDTRHAVLCGILAAQYEASAIAAIDRRITNRHLVIEGDAGAKIGLSKWRRARKLKEIQGFVVPMSGKHGRRSARESLEAPYGILYGFEVAVQAMRRSRIRPTASRSGISRPHEPFASQI